MDMLDDYRKTKLTITGVDGLPCSLAGESMILSRGRGEAIGGIDSPWPMPWLERKLKAEALRRPSVSETARLCVTNPEEPDQMVQATLESYLDLTPGELLGAIAERYPSKIALISQDGKNRKTYRELHTECCRLAAGLRRLGVAPGDRIGVWGSNSPEFIVVQFAANLIGAVFVPLNPKESADRVRDMIDRAGLSTLILWPGTRQKELLMGCPEAPAEWWNGLKNRIVIADRGYPGVHRWADIMENGSRFAGREGFSGDRVDHRAPAYMIFTSGTTGTSKGVVLSSGNVVENALAMADRMALSINDNVCIQAPLFHCFGCIAGVLTSVVRASTMTIMERFHPGLTLRAIEREGCTVVSGVPTMFMAFLEEIKRERYHISTLRTGIIAGSSYSPQLIEDLYVRLRMKELIVSYGLTEASPCITTTEPTDELKVKKYTVGRAIPGVAIKIVEVASGRELAPGQAGEICARGYNIMQGYHNMEEETTRAIDAEGWLHTGDVGILRPDGNLEIQCRIKDIIIRGGENISPKEIEDCIGRLEGVAEVYAVGVPDDFYGEEIMAFIRLEADTSAVDMDIRAACTGRLANYKIPRYIEFVDQFPFCGSGKVSKEMLKRRAKELRGYSKN